MQSTRYLQSLRLMHVQAQINQCQMVDPWILLGLVVDLDRLVDLAD